MSSNISKSRLRKPTICQKGLDLININILILQLSIKLELAKCCGDSEVTAFVSGRGGISGWLKKYDPP